MSTIREDAKTDIDHYLRELEKAKEKMAIVTELPLALQEAEGYATYNGTKISFTFYNREDSNIMDILKDLGIEGLNRHLDSYGGNYYYSGGKITQIPFDNYVTIHNAPPPEGCKLVKYTTTVERYKEECGE